MRYLTAQKHVKGLGAAHSGTEHFINQRLSAIALIVLLPLFLIFVAPLIGAEEAALREGFGNFWVGLIAAATLITTALHIMQGLQVVIEDYLHGFWRVLVLIAMRLGVAILTLAALWAVIMLALS